MIGLRSEAGRGRIKRPLPVFQMIGARRAVIVLVIASVLSCTERERVRLREPLLVIQDGNGKTVDTIPLPDSRFDLVFIHSIHLTKVEERFEIGPSGRLELYELRYENSGVGMPSDSEGGYRLENGKFVLSMDRSFDVIPLFVSIVPGHGIQAGGTFYPFTRWANRGEALRLSARIHQ